MNNMPTKSKCFYDNWTKLCTTFHVSLSQCVWIRATHSFMRHVDFRFYVVLESSTPHITNDWAMCCNSDNDDSSDSGDGHPSTFSSSFSFVLKILWPAIATCNYPILYAVKLRRAKVNKTVGSCVFFLCFFFVFSRSPSVRVFAQMLTTFVTETYFDRSITIR